eukprot:1171621-Pyramimonas_sp.AAC.1
MSIYRLPQVGAPRTQFITGLVLYFAYCVFFSVTIMQTGCHGEGDFVQCEGYLDPAYGSWSEWFVYFFALSFTCESPKTLNPKTLNPKTLNPKTLKALPLA